MTNRGIITVVGNDAVGIIAKVSTYLAETDINILDLSQTIVENYFNMMMVVDLEASVKPFNEVVDDLAKLGEEIGLVIRLQHEDIFNKMHRI